MWCVIQYVWVILCFFFFKQKTAYEMRISDWSSDVCSSDLMDGTSSTVGTESVDYSWDAGSNTLTATVNGGDRDGTDLFTVVVNPTSGQYTVTLLTNVLHTDDGTDNENDESAVQIGRAHG